MPGVDAAQTFAALSNAMAARLAQWRDAGFAAIRAAWLDRAAGLGETIRVTQGDGAIEGRFEGLDAAGRLVLSRPDGTVRIDSGDVFLGDATPMTGAHGAGR